MGGDTDNLVRYNPLNQSMGDLQNFINTQLQAIATGITAAGGTYTPGTLTIDISDAATPKIKTE